ncbi:hypothetical protein SAMN05216267_10494 [Actinacidiphila rubida]|uniref:Uncharacterized protein n=1 Tax=Actinacidiphila rubida TaxID=310780 RepID=A0A1H8T6P5_9ACTN|nr:hypothetical protein SAMN05216267_10494 [Actinacidiphila rubida]
MTLRQPPMPRRVFEVGFRAMARLVPVVSR